MKKVVYGVSRYVKGEISKLTGIGCITDTDLARMKTLKLHENVVREFEKDDIINQSEHGGILFWLDDNQKALVERFEKEYNAVVYQVFLIFLEILSCNHGIIVL